MYPLLICSLVIIFIAIERYLFYKSIDSGHLFTKQYCDILSGETLEKAFEFAKTHKGACANILTQASPLPTVERTEAFMEMKGNIVMSRLREKIKLFKCNYHISSTFRTFRNYCWYDYHI